MTLILVVWLVTTLIPSLKFISALACILCFVAVVIVLLIGFIEGMWKPAKQFVSYKKSLLLIVLLACIIPSKESTWYMIGAYGTQKLIENPQTQALAGDGIDVLKALMAKAKRELSDDTVKK